MARAKNLQPRGRLRRGDLASREHPPGRLKATFSIMMVALSFAAGISLSAFRGSAVAYEGIGGVAAVAIFRFLEYYAGVFSLVSLSLTVMGGLLATDRLVLAARHRVLLYAVHRALAATSVIFLVVHVLTKLVERHAGPIDVVVPFLADRHATYVGLGTIAGYLMMIVVWTGVVRWRFASLPHPWLWRVLHSAAYLAWPVALLHGLRAGRAAATWVNLSYLLCLVAVALALAIRLAMSWGRRMRAPRATTSGTIRPVGRFDADQQAAGRTAGRDRPGPRRRRSGAERPAVSPVDAAWLTGLRGDAAGFAGPAETAAGFAGPREAAVGFAGSRGDAAGFAGPAETAAGFAGPRQNAARLAGARGEAPWLNGFHEGVAWPSGPRDDIDGARVEGARRSGRAPTAADRSGRAPTTADYWGTDVSGADRAVPGEAWGAGTSGEAWDAGTSGEAWGAGTAGEAWDAGVPGEAWDAGVAGDGGGRDLPGEHRWDGNVSRPPELVDLAASLRATRESIAGMAGMAPVWRRSRQAF